jgi:hypothetical protein
MIVLRDVVSFDESIYKAMLNDTDLPDYLSRFYPNNSCVADYDTSKVCWFIIKEDTSCIGSVGLKEIQKRMIL